jgi:hypothetical protein
VTFPGLENIFTFLGIRGLVAAMLLYDIAAAAILAFAGIGFGMKGVGLWSAVVLHVVMSVWCVTYLLRSSLNVTKDGNLRDIPD